MTRRVLACLVTGLVMVSLLLYFFAYYRKEVGPELARVPLPEKLYTPFVFAYPGEELTVDKASAPQYKLPLDPSRVVGLKRLYLDEKALEILIRNGFVVTSGRHKDLAAFYTAMANDNVPVFVTTDSVLFVYHAFFNTLLKSLEEEYLAPKLEKLLKALVREAESLARSLPEGTLAREAATLDVAYLSVAVRLLDPSFEVPEYVADLVSRELALIEKASSSEALSPIFGYTEDYTQYKPRGHYTESETLKRYFKAMMWLGRIRFEASSPDSELSRRQTAQALILTYLMLKTKVDGKRAIEVWSEIYEPTRFLVGESDDPNFLDYIKLMREVYGDSFSPEDVNDEKKLAEFISKASRLAGKIISAPVMPEEIPRLTGLRFMGQRFILDGYIHQRLCHPSVPMKVEVTGLDVMAALGSQRALKYLEDDFKAYSKYSKVLSELRALIESMRIENWTKSVYTGWLYTIRALLEEPGGGYPTFMRTEAWLDKSLNTALASWAQLRHDTILYAKQPYAAKISLPPPPTHPGYVEPNPLLYSRLRNLVEATRRGLKKLGMLSPKMDEKLSELSSLLARLTEISLKELKGEPLSKEDAALLKSYGHILDSLLSVTRPSIQDPRIVADVYTDPNTRRVLEVATGYFDEIVVVYATPDGKLYAGVGLVMSYYEFYWPQTDRLTDEEWRRMLEEDRAPSLPPWLKTYKVSA